MKGVIFYVPLSEATEPAEGYCYCDRWWAVHPEKGVAFYARPHYHPEDGPAPLCNSDKSVTESLIKRLYSECTVVFLKAVYEGPAQKSERALRTGIKATYDLTATPPYQQYPS